MDRLLDHLSADNPTEKDSIKRVKNNIIAPIENTQKQDKATLYPSKVLTKLGQQTVQGQDETRGKVVESLESVFKNEECLLFHKFAPQPDKKVGMVLMKKLEKRAMDVKEDKEKVHQVRKNMSSVSKLLGFHLGDEDPEKYLAEEWKTCEGELSRFEKNVARGLDIQCILLVNFKRASVFFFDWSRDGKFIENAIIAKEFVENLLSSVPTEMVWNFMPNEIGKEKKPVSATDCDDCQKFSLTLDNIESGITKLKEDIPELPAPDRKDYNSLVSSIVLVSSLDTFPHSHTIGETRPLDDRMRLIAWNEYQLAVKLYKPKKIYLDSDYGTGKSLILHNFIETSAEDKDNKHNFIVSLQPLPEAGDGAFKTILDVSNSLRYEERENLHAITLPDIIDKNSKLRKGLGMEGFSDEPLQFIVDLTQKHPDANIAVDEANLRDLSDPEQKTICHEDFKGHLWISISSIYKHDFQEQGQTAIDLD